MIYVDIVTLKHLEKKIQWRNHVFWNKTIVDRSKKLTNFPTKSPRDDGSEPRLWKFPKIIQICWYTELYG